MPGVPTITVDRFNAFRVNAIGPHHAPFPLSISVAGSEGVWTVQATATRIADVVDVLDTGAGRSVAVLNLDQSSWLDDDYIPWSPRRIAKAQGVEATAHDVGWANAATDVEEDLLVLAWRDLPRFLGGWSVHNIDVLDLPGPEEDIDSLVLAVNTAETRSRLLPGLPGSRLYYSGHDDCYLYAETTDPSVPARLLSRLLTLFAGSELIDDGTDTVDVAEPGPDLSTSLLARCDHWVGTITPESTKDLVTVGLIETTRPWRLADANPATATYHVVYDRRRDTWDIENRRS
jgi:hypothetical protein